MNENDTGLNTDLKQLCHFYLERRTVALTGVAHPTLKAWCVPSVKEQEPYVNTTASTVPLTPTGGHFRLQSFRC